MKKISKAQSSGAVLYQALENGVPYAELMETTGLTRTTVLSRAKRHAADFGKDWPVLARAKAEDARLAYEALNDGGVLADVARQLVLSPKTVARIADRYAKETQQPPAKRGTYTAPFEPDRGQAPYEEYRKGGRSWQELAEEMGAPKSTLLAAAGDYARRNNLPWPIKNRKRESTPASFAAVLSCAVEGKFSNMKGLKKILRALATPVDLTGGGCVFPLSDGSGIVVLADSWQIVRQMGEGAWMGAGRTYQEK